MRRARIVPGLLFALAALTLLSGCQPPATGGYPVSPSYSYVVPTMTYLRDCPGYDCGVVSEVYSGDRVVVLDRNDFGWVRVQSDRTGAIGWLSSDLLSYSPVPASFYVSLRNVYLRNCADYNCTALELLHRGDRVDRLDQDSRGWWRVRSFRSGVTGWIPASALSIRPGPPYYYVNVSSLALRSGPSTGNRALTTLGFNQQVEVIGFDTYQPRLEQYYLTLYSIIYELLNNIAKHSEATHALLQVSEYEDVFTIVAEDNGVGFTDKPAAGEGIGMAGIRSKVTYYGGAMAIDSDKDQGLIITIEIPIVYDKEQDHTG